MREIHFSELQAWKRCRRRWWNRYHERLVSVETSDAFVFGSLWHLLAPICNVYGLEAAQQVLKNLTSEDYPHRGMLATILEEYSRWWPQQGIVLPEGAIEVERRAELPELGVVLVGTVDAIVHWSGGTWVLERKTASRIEPSHLFLDPQGLTYGLLVPEADGVLYEFARKADPNHTRYEMFQLVPRRIGQSARDLWKRDVIADLALMLANENLEAMMNRNFNPVPFMRCACEYEDLCQAQLLGRPGLDMYRRLDHNEDRPRVFPTFRELVDRGEVSKNAQATE